MLKLRQIDKFYNLKYQQGFTMAELMISIGLFTILMGIAVGGFIQAMRDQRMVISLMAINDSMSLTIEQMARDIRTGTNFSLTSGGIQFINAKGESTVYKLDLDNSAIEKSINGGTFAKITAENVDVKNFSVNLLSGGNYPPRITLSFSVSSKSPDVRKQNISVSVQTTVSARNIGI